MFSETASKLEYPDVRRDESVVEDYHGTKISDPYRWLEDPDSEETQKFVESQNNLTFAYLNSCPVKKQIKERLTAFWNYAKYGLPEKHGDKYYFSMNSGLQNQSILFELTTLNNGEEPNVFFDPNTLSTDGTISLGTYSFCEDGDFFAYALSESGSDWNTIRIKHALKGCIYPETLTDVRYSGISWTHDKIGFFYGRYPNASKGSSEGTETFSNQNQKIYYHRVGTSQADDVLVIEFPEHPEWFIGVQVSDDGNYLLCSPGSVIGQKDLYYVDLNDVFSNGGIHSLFDVIPFLVNTASTYTAGEYGGEKSELLICQLPHQLTCLDESCTNDGTVFYFRTNNDAPKFRVVSIDLNKPEKENWLTIIPEHPVDILDDISSVDNDKLVVCWLRDVKSQLELRNLKDGTLIQEFPLPPGTVSSTSDRRDSEFFFDFTSFTDPRVIYSVDLKQQPIQEKIFRSANLNGYNPSDFITEQVFYNSKDGTRIPMFLFHRKDFKKDGQAPTLIYGYGGFVINILSKFSASYLVFVQSFNGIIAQPSIRGGREYGKAWWEGGRLFKKQNVFDDFQSAAEYLIENGYTNPSKIAIEGYSNGGLLIGACLNQRPDLFGAAIAHVGVMDMLRFQKFTAGLAWCGEYGCSDDKDHFENLIKYSPLHNIRLPTDESVQYPAVLVATADHDDRVVPLHSYKFISELQHTIGSDCRQTNPLLIRIEAKAGHGVGKPTDKQIEERADIYSFLVQALGYKFY